VVCSDFTHLELRSRNEKNASIINHDLSLRATSDKNTKTILFWTPPFHDPSVAAEYFMEDWEMKSSEKHSDYPYS